MYKLIDNKAHFSNQEEEILKFWEEQKIFQKSLQNRKKNQIFFFYDGPPFATGLPHYGHILAGTIKDVIPRFQTMKGRYVERRFGWDCHGLPVEFEAEKELNLKGKYDIEKLGIAKFNEYCRSIVLRYAKQWRRTVLRMGRWADLDHDYKTMDKDFMETIWWVFDNLYRKDLIYLSNKIVAYSPRLNTPLSNFEVNLGYKMTQDPSITVKFKASQEDDTFFLAWTTTPWTLPANFALSVGGDIKYSLVQIGDQKYYLASESIARVLSGYDYRILKELPGKDLEYRHYEPLFPYFKSVAEKDAFFITLGDYVETETGTGIVHIAPFFGEDDFKIGKKYDLPGVMPFNDVGEFDDTVTDFKGLFFKDADPLIIKHLKKNERIFKNERIEHSYPFCWRTDVPLMYRAIPSWFLNVEKIKDTLLANNQKINWQPAHIKDGRMGKWLENARDWAISRNRFWGTTIPVWICQTCGETISFGSVGALEAKVGKKIDDLHRHFIDDLTIACENCGELMRRTPEVLDCWFESGAMPYGQEHYPFENKQKFKNSFPADFISEGLDQTRGWFYTLMVLSTALLELPAFKNCVVSGLILAEDGQKMSKRLKNYPDPEKMIAKYSADAIRLYMLKSGAIKAEELKFSEAGLLETVRGYMLPLWNVLNFFVTYANLDGWQIKSDDQLANKLQQVEHPLDLWILSRLESLIDKVTTALSNYTLSAAVLPLLDFIDELTNWYLRRSRRRFWKSELSLDKDQAYSTTYYVLTSLAKLLAPIIPFFSEAIYQILKTDSEPSSVHLCDYPKVNSSRINRELETAMNMAIKACMLGRALRTRQKVKLRQPLNSVTLLSEDPKIITQLKVLEPFIAEELNVKKLLISKDEETLINYSVRPNLPVLGKKYGRLLPAIKHELSKLTSAQIAKMLKEKQPVTLQLQPKPPTTDETVEKDVVLKLSRDDLLIDRSEKEGTCSLSEQNITLAMDFTITPELRAEGLSREVLNRIQHARKDLGLAVNDLIELTFSTRGALKEAIIKNQEHIKSECLCTKIAFGSENIDNFTAAKIDEYDLHFLITKSA